MDVRTGELKSAEEVQRMPRRERRHFIPVARDLREHEKAAGQIKMYAPCACGSGKKFRFCCFRKAGG